MTKRQKPQMTALRSSIAELEEVLRELPPQQRSRVERVVSNLTSAADGLETDSSTSGASASAPATPGHAETAEQRLCDLINSMPAVMWECDPHTHQITFQCQSQQMHSDCSPEDWATGQDRWKRHIHPDDLEQMLAQCYLAMNQDSDSCYEYRTLASDGSTRWLQNTIRMVRDSSGDIRVIRGFAIDITEHKRAEERRHFLAEASTTLASSLDYETTLQRVARLAVPAFADLCVVDVIDTTNPHQDSMRRVAASPVDPGKESIVQQLSMYNIGAPDFSHPLVEALNNGLSYLMSHATEEFFASLTSDPEHLALFRALNVSSFICVPLIARGRMLGMISLISTRPERAYGADDLALAEDLAHRAALAVDNARLYSEAREAVRTRDHFLSLASHELKTPLTALLGYARLLQQQTAEQESLGEREQRALRMIAQQTARFKDAINLLLDLSHIQAGNLKLTAVPLDLVALVRRVVADIRPLFAQHLIALQHSGTALMIDGDATRLQQALHNLLQHTIDHYPAGETIQVSLSQYKSLACLLIADQGRGPPDDVYPEMPAWSGHARSAEPLHPAGMSLGFSIAREIITLHGGSIDVTGQQGREEGEDTEGMQGRGHHFTVYLPLHQAQAS